MAGIRSIRAWEVLDSRGLPTVEAEVALDSGAAGRAMVPSGASTGEHEALELRDGDSARFHGKGVLRAVRHVAEVLAPALRGRDPEDQAGLDEALIRADGAPNKGRLGANALLAVSMAASRAAAESRGLPLYRWLREAFALRTSDWILPAPMLNILNGGRHADNGLDVQEFMIVPVAAPSFREALRRGAEAYQSLKRILAARSLSTAVGDEGGFAPRLAAQEEALQAIRQALGAAGLAEGEARISLDAAASEFHREGRYAFGGRKLSGAELAAVYEDWAARYGLLSIEDPFDEDDWDAWSSFTARAGGRVRVIGDDIFVTNLARLERGIAERAANAILVKLNQIGTVTETVRAILRAQEAGWSAVISHRSGETEDPYIADLAVALNAGAIKSGAPCRSERLAKYNRLLRIEGELADQARYAGDGSLRPPAPVRA